MLVRASAIDQLAEPLILGAVDAIEPGQAGFEAAVGSAYPVDLHGFRSHTRLPDAPQRGGGPHRFADRTVRWFQRQRPVAPRVTDSRAPGYRAAAAG